MLLSSGLTAPRVAEAGCTHYVLARGHEALSANDLELLQWVRSAELTGSQPQDRPSPCSGLSCSRNPMPPLAPAPAGPLRADLWACLSAYVPTDSGPTRDVPELSASARPVHAAFPPDRPPRAV